MTGYLDDPERNAEAMANGVYHTGDVATVDEDGYITWVGRADSIFKASDYKVSPFELANAGHRAPREWRDDQFPALKSPV